MRFFKPSVFLLACAGSFLYGQQPTPQKPPDQEEVVRVDTNLMQTDLMVFDKQGRFVSGLQRDQFELKVDNKPQPITILEQVRSGSTAEEAQRAKAFGNQPSSSKPASPGTERGRTVIFFIDDLHLSPDSLVRTRSMLNRFIDNEMGADDQVVIACATGDIGFLQQFTNNKTVLRAAVARLVHHPYNVHAMTREAVPMSEYAALTIERKDDPKVLAYYVEQCMLAAPPRYLRPACEVEVINRARLILQQAGSVTINTYGTFENLVNLASRMPGRKLSFFVSDGFLVDAGPRSMDTLDRLLRVIDKARQTGVVVYTIDARGLVSGALDATTRGAMDANGRLESMIMREVAATQDALNALARDTGGRALRNQNYFDVWVNKVLDETSDYYLLAWYFDSEDQNKEGFKNIKVQVTGHPEYEVRLPRGFIKTASAQLAAARKIKPPEAERAPEQEIKEALNTIPSRRDIPVSLSAVYLDTPGNGLVLTASVQVINEALTYETTGDKRTAAVDIVGLLFDDKGKKVGNFQTRLNIDALESDTTSLAQSDTIYNYRAPLKPGLYQVRVAARERSGGRIGSATQWVELPDLTSKKLAMSSLLLGIENIGAGQSGGPAAKPAQVQFSVDHNFSRTTRLRFITFIYNALRSGDRSVPDLDIQAQILRANQVVMTYPLRKPAAASPDPGRIPYEEEIQLNSIPPGRYTLQIKVTDRAAGSGAVQEADIVIR